MRMGRSGMDQAFHVIEFFNTDIKNFMTIKSSIKWVFINYLKVLVITSPLWVLAINYLMR